MGLLFGRGRNSEDRKLIQSLENYGKQGKWYKIVSTIAILGLFTAVGVLVVGITQKFLNAGLSLFLAIVAIICACAVLSLTWVRYLERKEHKKVSIAMLAMLGFAAVLWIVVSAVIYSLYVRSKNNSAVSGVGEFEFIRIALIISFQVLEALFITSTVIRYKKSYLVFQIIMYISNLFVDFWFSSLFVAFKFDSSKFIVLRPAVTDFLFNGAMITMLVLFVVYTIISAAVLRSIEDRKARVLRQGVDELNMIENMEETTKKELRGETKESPEERLSKLKDLYEKNLISEEEYQAQKSKIISEM